jgi:uncharacterized membrane protein YfcA
VSRKYAIFNIQYSMDNIFILVGIGFLIGAMGTLIGAGGGFILVPILLLTHPALQPDIVTAISMAVVASNAVSGSIAYARARRIDYRAGALFALFTIPGSIIGVLLTPYIPRHLFDIVFSCLLVLLAVFLFFNTSLPDENGVIRKYRNGWTYHKHTDSAGETYTYSYNRLRGIVISILVGFLSPLLGIGGGIIHVPALVKWLHFPVHIATATSHFILAIMSIVSVITHIRQGSYHDPAIVRMVIGLSVGVVAGAQLGAWLSHKIRGSIIVKSLAICLGLVGVRILLMAL